MAGVVRDRVPWWRLAAGLVAIGITFPLLFAYWGIQNRPASVDTAALVSNTALYTLFVIPLMLLHELAHAGAAVVCRLYVPRIDVGFGKRLARFHVGSTVVTVAMIPIYALTHLGHRSTRLYRLRSGLTIAAGPAFNLGVCWLILPWVERGESGWPSMVAHQRVDAAFALFCASAYLAVINLLPFKTRFGPTDGLRLLLIPFVKKKDREASLARAYAYRALEAKEEGRYGDAVAAYDEGLAKHPDAWVLRHDRAVVLTETGDLQAALAEYERLLDHPDAKGASLAMLKNNIAFVLLLLDPDANMNRIDEYSADALAELAQVPEVMGTRGSALVMRGELDDAIDRLKKAIDAASLPTSRAHNAAWLSLAYALAGDAAQSRRYLVLSKQLDGDCLSIGFVEPRIESALVRDAGG